MSEATKTLVREIGRLRSNLATVGTDAIERRLSSQRLRADVHHTLNPVIGWLRLHEQDPQRWPVDGAEIVERLRKVIVLVDEPAAPKPSDFDAIPDYLRDSIRSCNSHGLVDVIDTFAAATARAHDEFLERVRELDYARACLDYRVKNDVPYLPILDPASGATTDNNAPSPISTTSRSRWSARGASTVRRTSSTASASSTSTTGSTRAVPVFNC
jgi:hypothetical protein